MTLRAVLSFVGLQIAWFACVLGAAHGHAWLGPTVVLPALAIHVRTQPRAARRKEIVLLALAALAGFFVDTALLRAGVISVAGAEVSPPWLVVLWPTLAAATASTGSLASLSRRPLLGALLGAVGGAAAYRSGSALGAIGLGESQVRSRAIIFVAWSGVLPTLFWLRLRSSAPSGRRGAPETEPG